MTLFEEILGKSTESDERVSFSTSSRNNVTVLDPGVTRAFCESCREIINLLKVPSWTCPCGNTWERAPDL